MTTFFTYTGKFGTPGHHEIDIEIKGNQGTSPNCPGTNAVTTWMQTIYYVNGVGFHETLIPLCFDASASYHTYAFAWRSNKIEWSIDNTVVHTVYASTTNPLPSLPCKIMVNMWSGNTY